MAPYLPAPGLAPTLAVIDGIPTTTSLDVARHFGKQHLHVMERIRALLPDLPPEHQSNFRLVDYDDAKGEKRPAYNLTRDGFTLLAMGFTGARALKFKLAYIDAFNRMEAELLRRQRLASQEVLTSGPVRDAMIAGLATAIRVQGEFVMAVLEGKSVEQVEQDLQHMRFMTWFDRHGHPHTKPVEREAHVATLRQLAENVLMPDTMFGSSELATLGAACMQRLAQRL
jgi:Rha family phage regulatory protein